MKSETTQAPQITKVNNMLNEDRWCIDSQERSLNFVKPINFDAKFDDGGLRRGYELVGRINLDAYAD